MVSDLDVNGDGEVDIWEFSVHMQKRMEGVTAADVKYELDAVRMVERIWKGSARADEERRGIGGGQVRRGAG